jgi:hypothetical protein
LGRCRRNFHRELIHLMVRTAAACGRIDQSEMALVCADEFSTPDLRNP